MAGFAPIFVMVYDRLDTLEKCISSLLRCAEASRSVLYISSDQARIPADRLKVRKVREYIANLSGFQQVIPILHEYNRGLKGAFEYSIKQILDRHDRFIFLEDDIVVAPDFLRFMNEGLMFYENDMNILTVSGFSHSCFYDYEGSKKNKIYFTSRCCPWGFGTWRHKVNRIIPIKVHELKKQLENPNFVKKLDAIGIDLYTAFRAKQIFNEQLVLDYLFTFHMVRDSLFTVTPYCTKTFNIGNNGTGTRTKKSKRFIAYDLNCLDDANEFVLSNFSTKYIDNEYNFRINNNLRNRFKRLLYSMGLLKMGYQLNKFLNKKIWLRR